MDMKQKTIVIVAVVVVILAGVYGAQALNDRHDEVRSDEAMYYFYLDGMGDSNGWYSANGENAQAAFQAIASEAKLTVTFSDKGWLTIDEYPNLYEQSIGIGMFVYTSIDVSAPAANYFALGPSMKNIAGNIVYVTYSSYKFVDTSTIYEINPSTNDAWMTTGPFAEGSDYTPLEYETYYFYMGGVGDASGWYSASGETTQDAFVTALKDSGLTVTFNNGILSIDEYPSSYEQSTKTGKGFGMFDYLSTSDVPSSYCIAGCDNSPVLPKTASNIVFVYYGDYAFGADWSTHRDLTPMTDSAWQTGGPFTA